MKNNLPALVILLAVSCCTTAIHAKYPPADAQFYSALQTLCGAKFVGKMTYPTEGQDSFQGKELVADFRECSASETRVAFSVGNDTSRTWVFTNLSQLESGASGSGIRLKHDHRHSDGTPDDVTNYGGDSLASDKPLSIAFPADRYTKELIPAAATNVWTVSLSTDYSELRYDLTRHGKPRFSAVLYRQSPKHYGRGSQVSESVMINSANGSEISLRSLLKDTNHALNVVFLFGGGAMGLKDVEDRGGLWCPDSFADLKLLSSLVEQYSDRIGFIPIAIPPVFHTQYAGFPKRVFFEEASSDSLLKAEQAFISSTLQTVSSGVIPLQPYFDLGFNLLISEDDIENRGLHYPPKDWYGVFRAESEAQRYGVPSFWLVDSNGNILSEPFRGNVHPPHEPVSIKFTLDDVIDQIEAIQSH